MAEHEAISGGVVRRIVLRELTGAGWMLNAEKKKLAALETDLVKSQGRLQTLLDERDACEKRMAQARQAMAAGDKAAQEPAYRQLSEAEQARDAAVQAVEAVKLRIDRVQRQLDGLYAVRRERVRRSFVSRLAAACGWVRWRFFNAAGFSIAGLAVLLLAAVVAVKWTGLPGAGAGTRSAEAGALDEPLTPSAASARHALLPDERPLDEADPFSHMQSRWRSTQDVAAVGASYADYAAWLEEAFPQRFRDVRPTVKEVAEEVYAMPPHKRLKGLRQATGSLPGDLNGLEAMLLLGLSDRNLRRDMLRVLITQMRSQSLDPRRLPALLGDATGDLRFRMFETVEPYVAGPVPGDIAVSLMQGTHDAHRLAMIRLLIRHLEQPIDPLDGRLMIQHLDGQHTAEALAILGFSQTPEPF